MMTENTESDVEIVERLKWYCQCSICGNDFLGFSKQTVCWRCISHKLPEISEEIKCLEKHVLKR
jgi:hypothetical protein